MGSPQELTFDHEGIQDLAKDVDFLLGEITTQSDSNKGNASDFATAADIHSDVASLAGGGTTAYADAYRKEHEAVGQLYATLQEQLRLLQQLLTQTGITYNTGEAHAQQAVSQTNPDAAPSGPLGTTR